MKAEHTVNDENMYDVVIVGGGPAGLTAAIYLARAKYKVLVCEKDELGGQIRITDEVVNYPGIEKISGKALTDTMHNQAEAFGAEFVSARATALKCDDSIKTVETSNGDYRCFGILLATGAQPRTVGFKGEEENKGHGVAYCATCDGEFFTDKELFVIGGGFAAAEESVFLTKFARKVTILIREEDFTCAKSVADKARQNDKITVITDTVVEEVGGENGLDYIRMKNIKTGAISEYRATAGDSFGVFVFAGYCPDTVLAKGIAATDENGYIITDDSLKTSADGLYAAGDVCIKPLRQVVTAAGDGALAATELEKYVAQMQRETGIIPQRNEKDVKTRINIEQSDTGKEAFLSDELKAETRALLAKLQNKLILRLCLDERPVSKELERFVKELASLSEKLDTEYEKAPADDYAPCVQILYGDGSDTGLAFYGVPTGHEFSSFILALYNAAGPGQSTDGSITARIRAIKEKTDIKVLVTLGCTMCPPTVAACQKAALENKNISAKIYDIAHFDELRKRYNVMSVPCVVINDTSSSFGKKGIEEILTLIENQ